MAKGGMRYGAGRPGYKAKAEQLRKIDISRWQREGKLHAGDSFGWAWTMDGVQTASISVMVQSTESLRLLYTLGEDKRDASQQVRIDRTPCHFGNDRAWFIARAVMAALGCYFCAGGALRAGIAKRWPIKVNPVTQWA